jgi:dephospho-CoA kinase
MFQIFELTLNLSIILLKRMIKLGLTGGIGSGKSTIARIFEILGVPVFNSDVEAKKLYVTDSVLKAAIIEKFGNEAYLDSGEINRQFMISRIFGNKQMLEDLNSLVHPRVKLCFDNWVKIFSNLPLLIKEAAILFESGANTQVDKTLLVVAPIELRINRVIERDKLTRELVIERMKNQLSQEELIKKVDFVIDNSGKVSVIRKVMQLYDELSAK